MIEHNEAESLILLFETDPRSFISVKEAAACVGKGESTIRRWIDDTGKLDALKVGGTILVYRPSLRRMIKDLTAE